MKSILAAVAIAVTLAGCTAVPAGTAHRACDLLRIAFDEADLAPAWYASAGDVLHACGVPDAIARAEVAACAAQKRNGYTCD